MIKKLRRPLFLLLSVLILFSSPLTPEARSQEASAVNIVTQPLSGAGAIPSLTSPADLCGKLPPEQRTTCEERLRKTDGAQLTEALEALKLRESYEGLTPEEIIAGRQLLEQREKRGQKKGEGPSHTVKTEQKSGGVELPGKSLFNRARKIGNYQELSLDLKPFGYDFFNESSVRLVTDGKDIPVPLKYTIGPGDEVKLLFWGRVNAQYRLTVDRDGKITIPQIGPLVVAGMTFEEMSKQIIRQADQIVGTDVDISMGSLKTISVFVLGDVQRPGAYIVGSFSTITDALLRSGGPTSIGSMRNIQLKRKGALVVTFDLYDLLLKGNKAYDVPLMAGDVIFVPVTGPLVGIAGNVKRPAIYELRGRQDLNSLFDLAGGIIPTADTQQIQVERIIQHERQIVLDVNAQKAGKDSPITLQDADLVKVFSIVDANGNVVHLSGNVKRPGKYELKPGMRISDLIKGPEELLAETYFDYALVKRLQLPGRETILIPIRLGSVLLDKVPEQDIELQPEDRVFIFSRWFFRDKPVVTIEGEIRGDCQVGSEESSRKQGENTLAMAAEIKEMEGALRKQGVYHLATSLQEMGNTLKNNGRLPSDTLRIMRDSLIKAGRQDYAERLQEMETKLKVVCSMGLSGNMHVKDAILTSGGLTNDSYLERGEIIRKTKEYNYQTLYFHVGGAMAGDPEQNQALQDEDRIIIHSVLEQVYRRHVSLDGDVAKPGSYLFTEGMTVRDLIFKGGNVLESAYLDEAEISSQVSEEGRMVSKIERQVINLKMAMEGDPANNLALQPSDRLFVKRIPEWDLMKFVNLSGEFRFPGRYAVQKGEKLSSVIERAGGFTANAYLRGALFIRQSVKELQQQGLEETARRLERELLVQGSSTVSTALSAEEIKARDVEMSQKQKFIEMLKTLKAQGRMTIYLAKDRQLKGSEYDIDIEDGDKLHLPQKNNVVNVMGAVASQSSYIYLERLTYRDYIRLAGGYAHYADPSAAFVLKVDGSARRLQKGLWDWEDNENRWESNGFGGRNREVEPGDAIVIPEKFERIAWLREIRDITQILMNTAVVAAVLLKIF